MKKILFLLLFPVFVHAQTVTVPMLNQKLDSMTGTLDSAVLKTVLAPSTTYVVLDTLKIPNNSMAVFVVYVMYYDTVRHYYGASEQHIIEANVAGVYSTPYISYEYYPPLTTGLSVHQCNWTVLLVNGLPVIQGDGYAGSVIRWHIYREGKITPL